MTIGTTNIGFSTIATEVGLANTNLSLSDLCREQIVLDPANSRQTYTLTDNLTLTTADATVADNMNLASGPDEVSEFKSFGQDGIQFSSSSIQVSTEVESYQHQTSVSGSCIVQLQTSIRVWVQRSGNDLVFYADEGSHGSLDYHYREGTAVSGTQELARLAGVGTGATNVTQTISLSQSQGSGGIIGAIAFNTTGLTGTTGTTSSTNSKIGYNYYGSFMGECIPSGANLVKVYRHGFNITPVGKRVRTINFYTAIKSQLFTNVDQCC
tara:strand:+ start:343 stop:1146 length:804 start_codon:yes stop_codon:yes gene_type:complete